MTTRFLVGDVFDRMADMPDGTYDLIITSPPFLALRSYLPDGHPDKAKEIGSEATPAAFLDVMLALTAEWGRLLAPHGSIAIEIGDTYSGSGGAGGDYNEDGLRAGQPRFRQHNLYAGSNKAGGFNGGGEPGAPVPVTGGPGWPLAKSLAMIPELYAASLAYGRNLLTGQPSPAGQWLVRNFKPWIRSNPPVGALGDKERPATSYVTVATRAVDRYFDLDAVRTPYAFPNHPQVGSDSVGNYKGDGGAPQGRIRTEHPAGAPPLDWWHHVDAIIDDEIDTRAGKGANRRTAKGVDQQARTGKSADRDGNWSGLPEMGETNGAVGARGVHIRRRLEQAGILATVDALDISPKGYAGAHYAVWPPELVKRLILEMCPRRVCTTCGKPSRRILDAQRIAAADDSTRTKSHAKANGRSGITEDAPEKGWEYDRRTVGWSGCGHDTWRPGHVLDPFAGSGTTLAVASGMGRDSTGIDLDQRNAVLARDRVGMFLNIDWTEPDLTLPALPRGGDDDRPWITDQQAERFLAAVVDLLHTPTGGVQRRLDAAERRPATRRTPTVNPDQLDIFADQQTTVYDHAGTIRVGT